MRMASMMMPTMSDKSTAMFLKYCCFDFMKDSSLFLKLMKMEAKSIGAEIKELLFNKLVLPELKKNSKIPYIELKELTLKINDTIQLLHFTHNEYPLKMKMELI
jgi:hypothetical protein